MQVTILENFRTLVKGMVYDFNPYTVIVGKNGCGKTTLLQAIRSNIEDRTDNVCDLNHKDRTEFKKLIKVDSDYEKLFVFDATADKADSMNNAADAFTWVMMGGMETKDLSNGQVSQHYAVKIFQDVVKHKKEHPTDKILVILDELDTGFSIKYQKGYTTFCNELRKLGCDLIVASHSFLFLSEQELVLSFEDNKYIPVGQYLS